MPTENSQSPIPLEQWRVLEPLLDRALAENGERRSALLQSLGGEQTEVRSQLAGLLQECEGGTPLLEAPAAERFAALFSYEIDAHALLGDRYRIERELGVGGMATVYLADDTRHARKVAVKLLSADVSAVVARQRFLSEIRIVSQLAHPHILGLHDSGESDGCVFYVMPYVDGESLRDRLRRCGRLPVSEALQIAREVLDALAYAHGRGIIHRDIKPENILFEAGHAVLCDFGIAQALTTATERSLTSVDVLFGTPPYMSPEQAQPNARIDARSDLFSLGCVMYEMLASEPPARLAPDDLHSVRPRIPEDLQHVIMRCVQQDPAARYASADDVLHALASCEAQAAALSANLRVLFRRRSVARGTLAIIVIAAATATWVRARESHARGARTEAPREDVAQQVAAAASTTLTGSERQGLADRPTANPEAYLLYLQAREYMNRAGFFRRDYEAAQQLLERALALDPNFALGRATVSEVHGRMYHWRYDPSPARAARQRMEAETALRLAPTLPQAHAAMGMAHYWARGDYSRALDEFAIAVEDLPNDADLWHRIGWVHRRLGHWSEALKAFEKARELNPRDATLLADLGAGSYHAMHRYAEAVSASDIALSLAPDLHWAAVLKGLSYLLWLGQLDTLQAVMRALPNDAQLGFLGTKANQQIQLFRWQRQGDSLLHFLRAARTPVFVSQNEFLPSSLCAAWAHRLRGDSVSARAAFDSARVLLDSVLTVLPDDRRVHAAFGLALAGLGRRNQALREARWLRDSDMYSQDAFEGPRAGEERARILAELGETDAALDEIERLLVRPSWFSAQLLRLDPLWDRLRSHPRFMTLVAKYTRTD